MIYDLQIYDLRIIYDLFFIYDLKQQSIVN